MREGSEHPKPSPFEAAREKLNIGFQTAQEYLQQRRTVSQITTGTRNLNRLLGGGIETRAITEFFGEYRTGKTQICHQLTVTVQLPPELGGLSGEAAYIDTNIHYARAYNSDHQLHLAQTVEDLIQEGKNIKLIVVDSIIGHFRAEYTGRDTLAERQQKLNKHLHTLLKLSELHNLAVVVTNQVMTKPDVFFGDPTEPVGGHITAHNCTTRIYLRRSKANQR
ncbi:MAG: DNA repair and recombination protein RadA, partial [Candidatus Freyarchaeota archaeon]